LFLPPLLPQLSSVFIAAADTTITQHRCPQLSHCSGCQAMVTATKRAKAMDREGNGNGGMSDGDSDEEGNGEGGKSNGDVVEEGNSKISKSNGGDVEEGVDGGGKSNGNGNKEG
jgi:hypothetical protein